MFADNAAMTFSWTLDSSDAKNIRCKLGSSNDSFSVTVDQFPCTLPNIITGHKVQGQSLNSIILGTLSPIHQYGTTGWIYVILSRVRTLSGLFLMVKLCTDVAKYKPRFHVMAEMKRLRAKEKNTLHRLANATFENITVDPERIAVHI